ncbi:MAG: hypothetical protein J7J87_04775 [Candidatus Diapherotrites archaeon]|nr:hypothetical protein [Candidatus Diapherotrites archaeon]
MPRIRVAFKGPLLRERMELFAKGKRLGLSAGEIKKELDSSLRWHLENMDLKYIMRGFPKSMRKNREEWRKYLKKVAKLKARLPLKNPEKAYENAHRKIERIKRIEEEAIGFLRVQYAITVKLIPGKKKHVHISIPDNITLPELVSALTIVEKALKKQERLSAEANNRILELGLSIELSHSAEYKKKAGQYLRRLDREIMELGYNPLEYLIAVLKEYISRGRLANKRISKN